MKAYQRTIRETAPPEPDEDIKRALAQDFYHASVREIDFETAKPLVMQYEWLHSMGSGRWFWGLYFGEHLAGVEVFGTSAGTRVAESVAGVENANRVCELVRGLCLPWAHRYSASWFIPRACSLMADKYGKNIFVAYATEEGGGEVGQIYSSLNWTYTGYTQAAQQFVLDGKIRDSRQVSNLARDGRPNKGETQKYRRSRAEQKKLLLEQGALFIPGTQKHRFVGIYGSPLMVKGLHKAIKLPSLPYPKRDDALVVRTSSSEM